MSFANIREILSQYAGTFSPSIFEGQGLKKLIEEALGESNKWHKRHCVLQAPLILSGVIAMTIFRSLSIVNAFKRVFDAVRGGHDVPLKGVTDEAIYHARARLGEAPLRLVAKALGAQGAPSPSFLGLIPCAADGVKLTVPDFPDNVAAFGRPGASRGTAAWPQMTGVALVYVDTRKVIDCAWGRYNMSEFEGLNRLLAQLGPEHIVFLDRRYTKKDLWHTLLEHNTHFIIRLASTYKVKRTTRLGEGDWLAEVGHKVEIPLEERKNGKRWRWESRTMRVIQYKINDLETVSLLTDLLDPIQYPAEAIARGYHLRWEIELTYDEWETHLSTVCHGTQHTMFRSQTSQGILQEAWALVAAYNLIRGLMVEAGRAHSVPPLEISFVDTLEVVRMAFPQLQTCGSKRKQNVLYQRMLRDIADCRLNRPRRKRQAPRVVKVKMSKFPCKKKGDRSVHHDFSAGLKLVDTPEAAAA